MELDGPVLEGRQGLNYVAYLRQPGERWDAGERAVLCGLADFDLSDAFRRLHGYSANDLSWKPNGPYKGRRFDHVFTSKALKVKECVYHHQPREDRLSDHSPLETVFWGV